MKTSIAFAAFFLGAMSIANVSNAQSQSVVENEAFTARFTQVPGTSKVRVWIVKPAGKKVWITVKDAVNASLCYLEMSRRETQHLFSVDMKEMSDGKYVFELESGQKAADGNRPIVSKTVIKEKEILTQPVVGERFVFSN